MLLPRWESNLTPPACRGGILTTRPRGRLSFYAYQHVICAATVRLPLQFPGAHEDFPFRRKKKVRSGHDCTIVGSKLQFPNQHRWKFERIMRNLAFLQLQVGYIFWGRTLNTFSIFFRLFVTFRLAPWNLF
ncbi:hypothetical protein Zmor_002883 [Zophobas morio]|uniref:Uncharacterized protein n=1 Tax=Zophobas morio TaxID=2755281 RepID=A0AA38HKS8_9CUCU|nr:hypothetical protein Zmor_002883 [Zophobas morio]